MKVIDKLEHEEWCRWVNLIGHHRVGNQRLGGWLSAEKKSVISRRFSYVNSIKKKFQAWVNPPPLWKQTPTENIVLLFFAFFLNQAVQKAQPFTHRDYLINKFVWHAVPSRCLVWAWPVVTGCSLPPSMTAQAAFCALGWRPHWWLSWPEARASKTSSQLQDRKLHTTQSQHSSIKILTSEVHIRI